MPHAAGGRLQLQKTLPLRMSNNCFNAARGRWSVATFIIPLLEVTIICSFNAARGRWSVATLKGSDIETREGFVSMPHAAGGRLQLITTYTVMVYN